MFVALDCREKCIPSRTPNVLSASAYMHDTRLNNAEKLFDPIVGWPSWEWGWNLGVWAALKLVLEHSYNSAPRNRAEKLFKTHVSLRHFAMWSIRWRTKKRSTRAGDTHNEVLCPATSICTVRIRHLHPDNSPSRKILRSTLEEYISCWGSLLPFRCRRGCELSLRAATGEVVTVFCSMIEIWRRFGRRVIS